MSCPVSRAERVTTSSGSVVTTAADLLYTRQSSQLCSSESLSDRDQNTEETVTRPAYTNLTIPSVTLVSHYQVYHTPNVNPFGEITSRRSALTNTSVTQASTEHYKSQSELSGHRDIIRQLLLSKTGKTTLQSVPSNQNVAEIVKLLKSKTLHLAKQPLSGAQQEVSLNTNQGITQQHIVHSSKVQETQNIRRQLLRLQHRLKVQEQQKQVSEKLKLTGQCIGTGPPLNPVSAGTVIKSASPQFSEPSIAEEIRDFVDVPSPMTAGKVLATDRPKESVMNMDSQISLCSDLSPFVNTCGELPLSTDFIEASIYASSPNSLHLYEQEKIDMQCSMGVNTICSTLDPVASPDDFELKAQYENSQDISSLPFSDTMPVSKCDFGTRVSGTSEPLVGWESCGKPPSDVYIKTETPGMSTPTLAELNSPNYALLQELDDIDSYIHFEMTGSAGDISHDSKSSLKGHQDLANGSEDKTVLNILNSAKSEQTCSSVVSKGQFVSHHTPLTVVKTEPIELSLSSCGADFQKSLSPMTPVNPELVSVKRTVERNSPLRTIREIDISDASTLQRLLYSKSPLQAREPRKRTISEPQTSTRTVSSRKRSFDSTGLDMDKKWEEIKQFLHTETENSGDTIGSIGPSHPIKRERTRYDSTSSIMTLTSTEDDDSDSDKDFDDDSDSDMEGGHDISSLSPANSLIGTKDKQYFWQYNVQSKGPKGTRAKFDLEEDPHVLNDFEDPVFGSNTSGSLNSAGISIKHGGKARKGDGNDIVPSPKKLCQIGLQLRKINRQINDFVPVSELPSPARGKTRKEKNKLASRACRLKKKAQHEANKVKLHGLEMEHRKLLTVIHLIRHNLYEYIKNGSTGDKQSMTDVLESFVEQHLTEMVAGNTTEYVNSVIHKVEDGNYTGGLNIQATRSYPKELHN